MYKARTVARAVPKKTEREMIFCSFALAGSELCLLTPNSYPSQTTASCFGKETMLLCWDPVSVHVRPPREDAIKGD